MFFVYGTSGQMFRGTMEQLRQVNGVGTLARARRVAAIGRDGRDTSQEGGVSGSSIKEEAARTATLTAYAQTRREPIQRQPLTQVAQVMSHEAITLADRSTAQEALALLAANGIGQAPVVNGSGQLVGLISRAHLLAPSQGATIETQAGEWETRMAQNVTQLMRTPVPSVAAGGDIRRVARVLLDTDLPGLPVVDEHGRVIGFVSRSDLLRAMVNDPPLDLWV
jgi:CBS domain-containing protein